MKPDIKVFGKACPMFVPLVENGYTSADSQVSRLIAQEYLEIMLKEKVDTLILGCTHYPMLKDVISEVMGDEVKLISSGAEAAKHAQKILAYNDELCDREEDGMLELYCTDSVELFSENADAFLGKNKNIKISKCSLAL